MTMTLLADIPKSSGEDFTPSGKESTVMGKGVNLLKSGFEPSGNGFEGHKIELPIPERGINKLENGINLLGKRFK